MSAPSDPAADHADIQRRLALLQGISEAERIDASRLRRVSRELKERYTSVRTDAARAQNDARRAALNLLEDAEEARRNERREQAESQRAAAAQRESEERLRLLFNSMSEAFAVEEAIFGAEGRLVDCRFLEVNPAFTAQTGLENPTGRTMNELMPGFDPLWLAHYAGVLATGEPARFEARVVALDRWLRVSASRLGGPGSRRLAILFTDISEGKRAEAALRRSEALSRALIENLPGGAAFIVDHDLRYLLAGGEALGMVGYAPEDYVGRTVAEVRGSDEVAIREAAYRRALSGEAVSREHEVRGRSFFSRSVPLRDANGNVHAALAVSYDITARKQTEEALRLSEARFRTLADAVPQVIWTNTPDGQTNYVNQRWLDYSGQSLAEATGVGWTMGVHPDDLPATQARRERTLATGEVFENEYRLRRADGAFRWHLSRAVPLRDEAGGVAGWFGTATDIHDLKVAEAAIVEAQERLRLIVESALEHAIISLDLTRRIVSWNPGAERMFGYAAAEVIGQPCDLVFPPEDRAAGAPEAEVAKALALGQAVEERWVLRRDGSLLWGSCALLPMTARPGGETIGFVKIMRDETAALEARQALEQSRLFLEQALRDAEAARAEAEAASRAKDRFLAVLSHELRTPLTPVLMGVHLLARNRTLPELARETLVMIHRNVQLEVQLIDDLLDLTRVGRGKLELVREQCDLHHIIRRAVEVVASDLHGKAQRLAVALDAPVSVLSGDCTRLQQVCWNLLKNASKFTPEGGSVTVRTRAAAAEGWLEIEVSDTGIGLEPEVAERIFDPFEQADQSITRRFGGLGLGLAISKAIVEGHGGQLRVTSAGRGQGATFTARLPLA